MRTGRAVSVRLAARRGIWGHCGGVSGLADAMRISVRALMTRTLLLLAPLSGKHLRIDLALAKTRPRWARSYSAGDPIRADREPRSPVVLLRSLASSKRFQQQRASRTLRRHSISCGPKRSRVAFTDAARPCWTGAAASGLDRL